MRTAANAGIGIKTDDRATVPLCRAHHEEGHQHGWRTFEAKHGIDLARLAAVYAAGSGCDLI